MPAPIPELTINGTVPPLCGCVCEGFICEGYLFRGEMAATANVSFLKVADVWYRLCFEPHMIFWRISELCPVAWEVEEESWSYPHVDIGQQALVVGVKFKSCKQFSTAYGSTVEFEFENGVKIVIEDKNEITSYFILNSLDKDAADNIQNR